MYPMAHRLQKTLDEASFDYTDEELAADIEVIENIEVAESDSDSSEATSQNQLLNKAKETTKVITKQGAVAAKGLYY